MFHCKVQSCNVFVIARSIDKAPTSLAKISALAARWYLNFLWCMECFVFVSILYVLHHIHMCDMSWGVCLRSCVHATKLVSWCSYVCVFMLHMLWLIFLKSFTAPKGLCFICCFHGTMIVFNMCSIEQKICGPQQKKYYKWCYMHT
jgi:hypothetical protein